MSAFPRRRFLALAAFGSAASVSAQILGHRGGGWSIRGTDPVEIFHGDRRVSAYHAGYAEGLPFLDPLVGPTGALLTAAAEGGEGRAPARAAGLWFALDDVNGRDFHPESGQVAGAAAGAPGARLRGRIVHKGMNGVLIQGASLTIRVKSEWMEVSDEDQRVCSDRRELAFSYSKDGSLVVDALVELFADAGDLMIGGGEAGGWTLRLHPSLSWKEGSGEVALRNADSLADGLVPRARSRWIACQGKDAKGAAAGIAVLDHPGNPGAPTAWLVSDDGRLTARPFPESPAVEAADGAASAPWLLPSGESYVFRYRIIFHAGATDPAAIEAAWETFSAR